MDKDLEEYMYKELEKFKLDIPKPKIQIPDGQIRRLLIGYDKKDDYSCMVIGAEYWGSQEIWAINEFRNEQADFVYKLLTNPNVNINKFVEGENKGEQTIL